MKIEVTKNKDNKFELRIQEELILVHEKLSVIVAKIEQYLKMRFIPEEKSMFKELFRGFSGE